MSCLGIIEKLDDYGRNRIILNLWWSHAGHVTNMRRAIRKIDPEKMKDLHLGDELLGVAMDDQGTFVFPEIGKVIEVDTIHGTCCVDATR